MQNCNNLTSHFDNCAYCTFYIHLQTAAGTNKKYKHAIKSHLFLFLLFFLHNVKHKAAVTYWLLLHLCLITSMTINFFRRSGVCNPPVCVVYKTTGVHIYFLLNFSKNTYSVPLEIIIYHNGNAGRSCKRIICNFNIPANTIIIILYCNNFGVAGL
jgi:hypothetical protein